jgi:hypothetical protein
MTKESTQELYSPLALANRLFEEIEGWPITQEERLAAVNITRELVVTSETGMSRLAKSDEYSDAPNPNHHTPNISETLHSGHVVED